MADEALQNRRWVSRRKFCDEIALRFLPSSERIRESRADESIGHHRIPIAFQEGQCLSQRLVDRNVIHREF